MLTLTLPAPTPTPIADLAQATIDGERRADRFLRELQVIAPTANELHHAVSEDLPVPLAARNAFLRGFFRRIQKQLEVRP